MERTIPANIDAERATLGAVLLNRDAMIPLATFLLPEAFSVEGHALIYAAMLHCYQQRIPPDVRTVGEVLRQRGQLDTLGGYQALAALADVGVVSAHAEHYGRIVERTALMRRLIVTGGEISALGYQEQDDTDSVIAKAHELLTGATLQRTDGGLVPVGDTIGELFDELANEEPPGVPTGYADLDDLLGGWYPGAFVILAARPGVGKSACALNGAYRLAQAGERVQVFSLEMTRRECNRRLVALASGIPYENLRDKRLRPGELEQALATFGQIERLPIVIDETPGIPMAQLRARAMQDANQHGPPSLIVIDYLQLVRVPGLRPGYEEVSEVSRQCKMLAKALNTTVLGLAQLNREVEKRATHVPMLADLRESGQLEQDADIVIFPYREAMYDKETDKPFLMEWHVAKHRGGRLGVVPFRWTADVMRVDSLAYRTQQEY